MYKIMNNDNKNFPTSFRVIGVGNDVADIINKVNAIGLDGVSASVLNYPFECDPTDEDKLVIIISINSKNDANRVAKEFHDAGVLTIGLSEDADPSCYDSIASGVTVYDSPETVKALLQPVVTSGFLCYDFNDLSTTLRDSGFFMVKKAMGNSVEEVVTLIRNEFKSVSFEDVSCLSVNLYFNRKRSTPIEVKNVACLYEMLSSFPETVNVIWSVHFDDSLEDNQVRLVAVLAGKEVWECSTKQL